MFAGSLILGATLLGFAAWLHWNESRGWPEESGSNRFAETELDKLYHSRRYRARTRIHAIIAICGMLVLVAAFAGPGPVWMGAWMSVFVALMTVITLACFDAFRTHRYLRDKLEHERDRSSSG
jgi:hypothetical protein